MTLRTLLPAALLAAAALATPAHATCIQANMAGRWNVYAATTGQATHCSVTVSFAGVIGAANCSYYTNTVSGSATLTGGVIKLIDPARCTFQGNFMLDGVANTVRDLSLGKFGTAQGISTSPAGTFMLSLTRY